MKKYLVLALSFALSFSAFAKSEDPNGHWANTNLNYGLLGRDFISDKVCHAHVQTLFGCIDALNTILGQTEPGYAVLSVKHPAPEGFTPHMKVGDFQIYLVGKQTPNQKKDQSPLQALKKARAEAKERDNVWIQSKVSGFDKILDATIRLADKKREKALVGSAINAFLANAMDPHSYFIPEAASAEAAQDATSYAGIGALLGEHPEGMLVQDVFENSPAAESGLQAGDLITAVNGSPVQGIRVGDAVQLILGPENTKIALEVKKSERVISVELTRRKVVQKKVSGRSFTSAHGQEVGVISVRDFMGANTCQSFVELLKKYENASAVVVDLRGNGGGNLGISNCMLSVFLNPGERIISFQDPWENKTLHQDKASKSDYRFRGNLIVLTNQFSASASEIFAGVVQDYKLGIIVGDRTFGKGTVQGISGDGIPKEFGALQMARTIARFHLPSGRSNQLVGVAPDVLAYSQPIPKEEELMSFREGDQYRFPIPPGPKVQTPANPKAFEVRACIRKNGKAAEVYQKMGDHQLQVAADVAACL